MREKSNGAFSGQGGFFHIAATNKRARQRRRWMAAPCGCSFELAMRLRDNDHWSGLARTRRQRMARNWTRRRNRTRRRARGRARRRGTVHNGRVAVMAIVVIVVMMATEGREGQGAGNQQGEEFTHGHVSFCCGGTITDGFVFVFFRCLYPLI